MKDTNCTCRRSTSWNIGILRTVILRIRSREKRRNRVQDIPTSPTCRKPPTLGPVPSPRRVLDFLLGWLFRGSVQPIPSNSRSPPLTGTSPHLLVQYHAVRDRQPSRFTPISLLSSHIYPPPACGAPPPAGPSSVQPAIRPLTTAHWREERGRPAAQDGLLSHPKNDRHRSLLSSCAKPVVPSRRNRLPPGSQCADAWSCATSRRGMFPFSRRHEPKLPQGRKRGTEWAHGNGLPGRSIDTCLMMNDLCAKK